MLPTETIALGVAGTTPFAPDRIVYKVASRNRVFTILSGHEAPSPMVTVTAPPEQITALREGFPTILPAWPARCGSILQSDALAGGR